MDFEVIHSYIPLYTQAFLLTIKIGWIGIVIAVVIGIATAFLQHFKVPVLAQIASVYVEIFRPFLYLDRPRHAAPGTVILYLFRIAQGRDHDSG